MSYQHLEPVSKQLTIVVGLTVVGFMAFGLALSYYRNILFDQTLVTIEDQNDVLRATIEDGYRELSYYRSTQYRDKYAKENLGLVNPGEKVLIITEQATNPLLDDTLRETREDQQEIAYFEVLRQMPVIEHWQLYLFNRKRADELKRGL